MAAPWCSISHFLTEVLSLADTVSVMRDGVLVRTRSAAEETEASLIEAMLGRSLGSVFPPSRVQPDSADQPAVLEVQHFSAPGVHDVSFSVRPGEIVGLAGLVGAGRTELARAVFGDVRSTAGTRDGQRDRPDDARSPKAGIEAGMFLIPESRKDSGLLLGRSVVENVTLSTHACVQPVAGSSGRVCSAR